MAARLKTAGILATMTDSKIGCCRERKKYTFKSKAWLLYFRFLSKMWDDILRSPLIKKMCLPREPFTSSEIVREATWRCGGLTLAAVGTSYG